MFKIKLDSLYNITIIDIMKYKSNNMTELSQKVPFVPNASNIHSPSYGRYLEDFEEGYIFEHQRGITLTAGFMYDFAMTYFEMNPLHINVEYARSLGYTNIPATPMLVFNIILSLGVQDCSEKAYANLGYYDVHFLKRVYAGDTLRSVTKILEKKTRGEGKPGIITLLTVGLNQKDEVIIQYRRKIMVLPKPEGVAVKKYGQPSISNLSIFKEQYDLDILSYRRDAVPSNLTSPHTYYEDFKIGDVITTQSGRTLTNGHFAWTYKVGNTHPLHFDTLFSKSLSGAMSGEPIIYGGLIFACLVGLTGRDVSDNAIWDLGYTEGYHTQPCIAGDTIYAIHRVIGESAINNDFHAGMKQFQLIGIKNMTPKEALNKYGADLFIKENDKKDMGKSKIPEKVFEVERQLLLRTRN